jgi:hypothetical protein
MQEISSQVDTWGRLLAFKVWTHTKAIQKQLLTHTDISFSSAKLGQHSPFPTILAGFSLCK